MLETLTRHADIPVASALLIGVAGARLASPGAASGRARVRALDDGRVGGCCWEAAGRALDARPRRSGVLAGSVAIGLGRMVGRLPGVNDGVVRLEETEVEGMAASTLVPQPHSWMPVSPGRRAWSERFLRTGSFA